MKLTTHSHHSRLSDVLLIRPLNWHIIYVRTTIYVQATRIILCDLVTWAPHVTNICEEKRNGCGQFSLQPARWGEAQQPVRVCHCQAVATTASCITRAAKQQLIISKSKTRHLLSLQYTHIVTIETPVHKSKGGARTFLVVWRI